VGNLWYVIHPPLHVFETSLTEVDQGELQYLQCLSKRITRPESQPCTREQRTSEAATKSARVGISSSTSHCRFSSRLSSTLKQFSAERTAFFAFSSMPVSGT
jgi:hypothetical protein